MARQLPVIQRPKRNIPIQQIISVEGQSPVAQGIDVLSQALARRNALRQQAQQVAAIAKAAGQPAPDQAEGLTPDIYEKGLNAKAALMRAEAEKPGSYSLQASSDDGKSLLLLNNHTGETKAVPNPLGSLAPKTGKKEADGGYIIPRGLDPETGRPVYSMSKKLGLFYDDGKPFKGSPSGLTLKPLPADQIQKEMDFASLKFSLDRVKGSYNPDYVGPFDARFGKGKQYFDSTADPAAADFYGNLADLRNQLLYLRSGKQINEQEYKRLLAALPNENLSSVDFDKKLSNFEELYNTMTKARHAAMGGYLPPKTPKPETKPQPMPPPAPSSPDWGPEKQKRLDFLRRKKAGGQ